MEGFVFIVVKISTMKALYERKRDFKSSPHDSENTAHGAADRCPKQLCVLGITRNVFHPQSLTQLTTKRLQLFKHNLEFLR